MERRGTFLYLREYLKRSSVFIAIGIMDKFSLTTFMERRAHDAGLGDRQRQQLESRDSCGSRGADRSGVK